MANNAIPSHITSSPTTSSSANSSCTNSSSTQSTTQTDLTYEYQWLEELQACTEAVLFLITNEACQSTNVSPAVKCLLQGCDDMSKQLFVEANQPWAAPIDTQSIAARVASANKLAQNQKERNDGEQHKAARSSNWMVPVQQLYFSLNTDLNNALLIRPQRSHTEHIHSQRCHPEHCQRDI